MKNLLTDLRILIMALIAGMAGLFSGCIFGPSTAISDEFARMASQEVANMSENSSGIMTSSAQELNKLAAAEADTVYYDWKVHPYSWDATIQGYIRTATVTGSDGYERVRVDTVIFKDVSGTKIQHPTLATCKTIDHIRNMTHTKGGSELNIRVVMNSVISLTPDTTHVKNGTITGTYDGEQVGTGTITNVTRAYTNGAWQFPRSGNVTVDFPRRSYNVDFSGNGRAKLTITNKVSDKTTIITIQVDER
jgi:hypothetical protein